MCQRHSGKYMVLWLLVYLTSVTDCIFKLEKEAKTPKGARQFYHVYVSGEIAPKKGNAGDIWFSAKQPREAFAALDRERTRNRAEMGKYEGKLWFCMDGDKEWIEVDRSAHEPGSGVTTFTHPLNKAFSLDCIHFTWRAIASISRQRARNSGKASLGATVLPASVVTKNAWILPLIDEWKRIAKRNTPNVKTGCEILTMLLAYPEVLSPALHSKGRILARPVSSASWARRPHACDVVKKFIESPDDCRVATCSVNQAIVDEFQPTEVLCTLMRGDSPGAPFCSLLDIRFSQEEMDNFGPSFPGIDASRIHGLWGFTLVPPSGITNPHVDSWVTTGYATHFEGRKLWLLWPGTKANVEKLYRGGDACLTVIEAIKRLEGLEVLLLDEEVSWFLPAGTIHAVLTFSFAFHGGFYYLDALLWKESQAALESLQAVVSEYGYGDASDTEFDSFLKETMEGMKHWFDIVFDDESSEEQWLDMGAWVLDAISDLEWKMDVLSLSESLDKFSKTNRYLRLKRHFEGLG